MKAEKKENFRKVDFNLYGDMPDLDKTVIFKIGDTVRISEYKRKTFDKGYTNNWTEEVFIIDEIKPTNPIPYSINDLNGEKIKGSFYTEELQKTDQQIFRIEKVIRKTKDEALVEWKGYPNEFNS